MPPPVPVTVVAGFLGSGKTTLLNRVLHESAGRAFAVIVNELGEIGIDGDLIEGAEGFVELENGCLCCALNEDLVATLGELGARERLDQVFIETTGIADPWPIARAVQRPELGARFRVDAVVVTVDACNFAETVERHPEVALQIARGDFLLLTKTGLVGPDAAAAVAERVRAINPEAAILFGSDPGVLGALLEPGERAPRADAQEAADLGGRAHGFDTLAIDVGVRPTIRLCFEEFLESLPGSVYRSKGIVKIDGEPGRLVFHTVGRRRDLAQDEQRSGSGRLVFIGKGIDRESLRAEVASLFEEA